MWPRQAPHCLRPSLVSFAEQPEVLPEEESSLDTSAQEENPHHASRPRLPPPPGHTIVDLDQNTQTFKDGIGDLDMMVHSDGFPDGLSDLVRKLVTRRERVLRQRHAETDAALKHELYRTRRDLQSLRSRSPRQSKSRTSFVADVDDGCSVHSNATAHTDNSSYQLAEVGNGTPAFRPSRQRFYEQEELGRSSASAGHGFMVHDCWSMWVEAYTTEDESSASSLNSHARNIRQRMSHVVMNPREEGYSSSTWLGKHITHPNSAWKIFWDILAVCFILYDTVTVPLDAFNVPMVTITTRVSLAYWTLDIAFSFCVGYYRRGVLEMRPSRIAFHYLTSWLVFDVSVVTLDWVGEVMASDSTPSGSRVGVRTLRTSARIIRGFRLLRLLKLQRFVAELQSNVQSEYTNIFVRVLKLIVIIALVNHVIACAWYAVGNASDDGWVNRGSLDGFNQTSVGYKYTTSLHWSLTQFTPASMEVFPTNSRERTFAVLTLLFALVVFSSFVSSITSAMSSLRKLGSGKRKQFMALRSYLKENAIPGALCIRIQKHLQYTVTKEMYTTQAKDVELLHMLSKPLMMELQETIIAPLLAVHPFFRMYAQTSILASRKICSYAAAQHSASVGDVVAHAGEVASATYFVVKGCLGYTHAHFLRHDSGGEDMSVILREKEWIGEMALWLNRWVYRGEIAASTNCDFVAVDAEKFRDVSRAYPKVMSMAKKYAYDFVEQLRNTQGSYTDLMHEIYPEQPNKTPKLTRQISQLSSLISSSQRLQRLFRTFR